MSPEDVTGERRETVGRVTHETTDCVRVQSEQERDEQVVGVPEGLERLLANSVVRSRVHEKHAEKHDVASDTARLSVVDLQGENRSDLRNLNVEEAGRQMSACSRTRYQDRDLLDIMRSNMGNGEEQHGVGDLTMEPEVLIQRQEPDLRSKPSHQCPTYWQQYEQPVETQHQTGTTGNPDGKLEAVETREPRIGRLFVPVFLSAYRARQRPGKRFELYHPKPNRKKWMPQKMK